MKKQTIIFSIFKHFFALSIIFFIFAATIPTVCTATKIVYIDPDNGDDSWSGIGSSDWGNGVDGPWKTFANLADTSLWDEARLIKNRTFYVDSRVIIQNAENKVIKAHITAGTTPQIKSYRTILSQSEWTQLPNENIWVKEFTTTNWNPPYIIGFGTVGSYGERVKFVDTETGVLDYNNSPSNAREWDFFKGKDGITTKLYVYSLVNPAKQPAYGGYGTIYYQSGQHPVFRFEGARNVTISGLRFSYGYTPASFYPGTAWSDNYNIKVENCLIEDQYFGLKINGDGVYRDVQFVNNDIYRSRGAGMHIMRVKSADIYDNFVSQACLSESTGGIYCASIYDTTSSSIVKIHDNEVEAVKFGNYWPSDGGGIYFDHDSKNGSVYNNYIHSCYLGLQDNSAGSNMNYYNNLINYCDVGFIVSDSDHFTDPSHVSNVYIRIYNNTFAGIGELNEPGQQTRSYIMNLRGFKPSGSMFEIRNNILHSSDSTMDGIKFDSGWSRSSGDYSEDHNCYYGVLYANTNGTELPIHVDSIIEDPRFDWNDYSLNSDSPCVNGGSSSSLIFEGNIDFLGNQRVYGTEIDMGAMERQ